MSNILIALGWTAFLAENLILSENRKLLIQEFGDKNYHNLYNTLSTIACGTIALGFYKRNKNLHNFFNHSHVGLRFGSFGLRALGLIGISQQMPALQIPFYYSDSTSTSATGTTTNSSLKSRCPMDFSKAEATHRITRHPSLFSFASISLSIAIVSPYTSHLIMFGYPALFAIVGGAHQDSRFKRGLGGNLSSQEYDKTSLLPFKALMMGQQSWSDVWVEMKVLNAALATILAAVTFLV